MSMSEARELVARAGESVSFITVDRVQIVADRATVWTGDSSPLRPRAL